MKNKHFDKGVVKKLSVFMISLFFCYFAAIKEIHYAAVFLVIVLILFERVKENQLLLLKIISPFYIVPLAFYSKFLGILALILSVFLFSVLYIFRHVKKINVKKLGRIFFVMMFLVYFLINLNA